MLIVLLVGYFLMKVPASTILVGIASGATGNPAILVYSNRMAPTERPDIGYAMIFPSMTIVKVVAVQIVGLLIGVGGKGEACAAAFNSGMICLGQSPDMEGPSCSSIRSGARAGGTASIVMFDAILPAGHGHAVPRGAASGRRRPVTR